MALRRFTAGGRQDVAKRFPAERADARTGTQADRCARPSAIGSRHLGPVSRAADDMPRAGRAVGAPCPECGFTTGSLPTDGLVVAVMAIPSRYHELLARFGSLEETDVMLRDRRDATAWSALERIAHVADSLHAAAKCAFAILEGDRDRFAPIHIDAPRAGSNATPSRVVLASLRSAVTDLASSMSHADVDDWDRRAQLGERTISVRDVLDEALHEAGHHLADVEALLGTSPRLRLQPT